MRRDRFSVSCFISEVSCWLILETAGGVDTSSILSASSASCGRDKWTRMRLGPFLPKTEGVVGTVV